ncbi:hypothetical protein [Kocuria rosea]|uniref:hypothetical protein n=1 Tax=Kocuria rosea TaxID=1275 RepID=UPI0011A105BF|nr:hypothetical protein [Kocuria rosea]
MTPTLPTTFSDWLRAQRNRQDPVGDLARDFIAGTSTGAHDDTYSTPEGFLEDITALFDPPATVMDAIDRAAREWGHQ